MMRKRLRAARCLGLHDWKQVTSYRMISDELCATFPGVVGYYFEICRRCGKIRVSLAYQAKERVR